jgi:transposase
LAHAQTRSDAVGQVVWEVSVDSSTARAHHHASGARRRPIPHTIPERRDQRAQRASRPGRPLTFDTTIYARRNVVERCINRLKQWRGLATRYEKRAVNYRAMLVLASIVLWLEG